MYWATLADYHVRQNTCTYWFLCKPTWRWCHWRLYHCPNCQLQHVSLLQKQQFNHIHLLQWLDYLYVCLRPLLCAADIKWCYALRPANVHCTKGETHEELVTDRQKYVGQMCFMDEEINLRCFKYIFLDLERSSGSCGQELRTAGLCSRSKSSNQWGKEGWKDNLERESGDRTVKDVWRDGKMENL